MFDIWIERSDGTHEQKRSSDPVRLIKTLLIRDSKLNARVYWLDTDYLRFRWVRGRLVTSKPRLDGYKDLCSPEDFVQAHQFMKGYVNASNASEVLLPGLRKLTKNKRMRAYQRAVEREVSITPVEFAYEIAEIHDDSNLSSIGVTIEDITTFLVKDIKPTLASKEIDGLEAQLDGKELVDWSIILSGKLDGKDFESTLTKNSVFVFTDSAALDQPNGTKIKLVGESS